MESNPFMALVEGKVPSDGAALRAITVGTDKIAAFWRDRYLREYIPAGGSKIKFLTGKKGSGKSHLLALLSLDSAEEGYATVNISARDVKLNDITNLFTAVVSSFDLSEIAKGIAKAIASELGYDISESERKGQTLFSWLEDAGELDGYLKQEFRTSVKKKLTGNPRIDANLGNAFGILTGEALGSIEPDKASKEVLRRWLTADKTLKLSEIKPLGLAPCKISKTNARGMLSSFAEILRLSGKKGLFVAVDDLDALLNTSSLEKVRYTKMQRDDTYECIRQLIDDIDNFRYSMFVFAFDKSLETNERFGLKTYQALWMRIQNEILSDRVNLFSDLLDLDTATGQLYTVDAVLEMNTKLRRWLDQYDICTKGVDREYAEELIRRSNYGSVSLPLLVNQATIKLSGKEA